ncbi:MAG TPA: NB-ARC domain-containing protein [Catenuloplanes sp.]
MTPQQALSRFADDLRRIRELAGSPSLNQIVALTTHLRYPLARSTISDKLNAKSLAEWDFVVSFVDACRTYADQSGAPLPAELTDLARWDVTHRDTLREIDDAKTEVRLYGAAQRQIVQRHCGPTTPATSTAARSPVVPRQLPAMTRAFTGRHEELRVIADLVDEVTGAGSPRVLALDGMAGIGKTALAVYAAHLAGERFPDGQLWVDLRGFGPADTAMAPMEALAVLLDGLGVPADQIPAGPHARSVRYRSLVAGRRLLIVLDNARDSAQVRPLLPGSGACLVLVTSRMRLTGLAATDGADLLTVALPDQAESRDLLARRLGEGREMAWSEAADEVIARCARLPLALSIVAARAAHPAIGLSALADELREGDGSLDGFDGGDPACDVRSAFSWSVDRLSPGARSLFHLICGYPGPALSARASASLAGVPVRAANRLLAELAAANLVTQPVPERYVVHGLLRAYGAELAGAPDRTAEQQAAMRRLSEYYLHSAYAAAKLLDHHRQPIPLPPPAVGVTPEVLDGYRPALSWLTAECPALLAAVSAAGAAGSDAYAWRLGWTLTTFLDRQGQWHDLVKVQETALSANLRLGSLGGQAQSHCGLGRAYVMVGRHADARHQLRLGLAQFRADGNSAGVSCAQFDLAILAEREGRQLAALARANQALHLYQQLGHPTGPARALAMVSRLQGQLGDVHRAVLGCQQAIRLQQQTGDQRGEAASWASLGIVRNCVGDLDDAASCNRNVARLSAELGDRYYERAALARVEVLTGRGA